MQKQWSNVFKVLKRKRISQTRILYQTKLFYKNEEETLSSENKHSWNSWLIDIIYKIWKGGLFRQKEYDIRQELISIQKDKEN